MVHRGAPLMMMIYSGWIVSVSGGGVTRSRGGPRLKLSDGAPPGHYLFLDVGLVKYCCLAYTKVVRRSSLVVGGSSFSYGQWNAMRVCTPLDVYDAGIIIIIISRLFKRVNNYCHQKKCYFFTRSEKERQEQEKILNF